MVFAALLLLICLGVGYLHFYTSPALRPVLDRVDAKTFYVAMVVKGFYLFCGSMLSVFLLQWALGFLPLQYTFFIYFRDEILTALQLPALNRDTPFEARHLLSLVVPVLFVLGLNYLRKSCRELRKQPKYCIWKVSDTLERWFIKEAGLMTRETKGGEGPEMSRLILDNDKVYIGIILSPELDNGRITHVQMAPFYSGCLDKDDKSLKIVERYSIHYKNEVNRITEDFPHISHSSIVSRLFLKFAVTIPVDRIVTVSSYSPKDREKLEEIKKHNTMLADSDEVAGT